MKKTFLGLGIIALLSGGLTGCASFSAHQYQNTVEKLIADLNQGREDALVKASSVPFLVDQEIILLPKDLVLFWHNLVAARFMVKEALVKGNMPVDKATYRQFAATMEGESFFANYVSAKAYWVIIETPSYRLTLLLDKDKVGKRILKGWKGPESL